MSEILFINACPRDAGASRTEALCGSFFSELEKRVPQASIREIALRELDLADMDQARLRQRDMAVSAGDYSAPMFEQAKIFAAAEKIVIGAPYWDLCFPARLKLYIENICVDGLTFRYTEQGPQGLCRGKELLYITTSGGFIGQRDFGTQYLRGLSGFLGIGGFRAVRAEGLDIQGLDAPDILRQAAERLKEIAADF